MPIRRFKTMLLSQNKQYGFSSGKALTYLEFLGNGGSVSAYAGYRIHRFTGS